jgi:drug/metabolite transporter (DMT)-like permease
VPYVQLLGAQLAIGAAAIFARLALTGAGPLAVSALRLSIAAAVMAALAAAAARMRLPRSHELLLAIAGVALAAHFGLWITSLQYTSVAVSTLLVTTTPLFTEAYDAVRLRRPPSVRLLSALALAAAGLVPIVAQREAPAPIPGHGQLGALLALGGAVAIGIYLTVVQRTRAARDVPTLAIVARTYGWAALVLVAASAAAHQGPPALGDGRAWLGIAGMALISQVLGHTGMNAALKHFSPTLVSTTTLLEPVFAAVLAALLLHEMLSPPIIGGGLLVLAAVGIALGAAPERPESVQAA